MDTKASGLALAVSLPFHLKQGLAEVAFLEGFKHIKIHFLQSLLCRQLRKRKLLLEKATGKELRVLQKLLSCYVRGELPISSQVYGRIKRARKLGLLESQFKKIKFNPQLKRHLLSLASVLHLLIKPTLAKRLS